MTSGYDLGPDKVFSARLLDAYAVVGTDNEQAALVSVETTEPGRFRANVVDASANKS